MGWRVFGVWQEDQPGGFVLFKMLEGIMIEAEWLFDPEYPCVCSICGEPLPRRLLALWYGDLYCEKCFEIINPKEGDHGLYRTS